MDTAKGRWLTSDYDRAIGQRLRYRRLQLRLTTVVLGGQIGVSFQLIQKYESGECRIGAGRLYDIAVKLQVPISYFFAGLDAFDTEMPVSQVVATAFTPKVHILDAEAMKFARAFARVRRAELRQRVAALVRTLAVFDE